MAVGGEASASCGRSHGGVSQQAPDGRARGLLLLVSRPRMADPGPAARCSTSLASLAALARSVRSSSWSGSRRPVLWRRPASRPSRRIGGYCPEPPTEPVLPTYADRTRSLRPRTVALLPLRPGQAGQHAHTRRAGLQRVLLLRPAPLRDLRDGRPDLRAGNGKSAGHVPPMLRAPAEAVQRLRATPTWPPYSGRGRPVSLRQLRLSPLRED